MTSRAPLLNKHRKNENLDLLAGPISADTPETGASPCPFHFAVLVPWEQLCGARVDVTCA
jgi:hypothetical protein